MATPFPAPTAGFPAATGGFPFSPSLANPTFGVNPFTPQNDYLGSGFAANTQALLSLQDRAAEQTRLNQAAQFAVANRDLGGALPSDPHTWTPEEAAHQTDLALAKLSTVNPDLAARLAAQRTGQDTGGGFFGALKSVVGEVLHPALSVGGKLLDVIGRTANIVPNIAFDVADGGSFMPGADIGGALTGTVRHNWNAVFQEVGWTGGGLGGILRASLGLVGDMATDPLSYVIPVGAGVHSGEAGLYAAREAVTKAPELLAEATRLGLPRAGEDATAYLGAQFERFAGRIGTEGMAGDALERGAALTDVTYRTGEYAFQQKLWETADRVYNLTETRALGKVARLGDKGIITTLSDGTPLTAKGVKDLLEKAVKDGAWHPYDSTEWKQAQAFAATIGGARLKIQLPFTAFRYISPALELGKFVPGVGVATFSRFFAGKSGATNLFHEVFAGRATFADATTWMERGWNGLMETSPDLVTALRGRGKNLGGMFYSLSEQAGRITEHLSRPAQLARRGLVGAFTNRAIIEGRQAANSVVYQSVQKAVGQGINLGDLEAATKQSFDMANKDVVTRMAKFVDYFPETLDATNPSAVTDWWNSVGSDLTDLVARQNAGEVLSPDDLGRLAQHNQRLADRLEVAAQFTPAQQQLLQKWGKLGGIVSEETAKYEGLVGPAKFAFDDALGLHPSQVGRWQMEHGIPAPVMKRRLFVHPENADAAGRLRTFGIDDRAATTSDLGYGIRVTTEEKGGTEVAGRGSDFIYLDDTGDALLPNAANPERKLSDARAEIHNLVAKLNVSPDGASLGPFYDAAERAQKEAKLLQDEILAARPEVSGIVRRTEAGYEAVLFNPKDVKLTGEHMQLLAQESGYLHPAFNTKALEWVRGKVPKEGFAPTTAKLRQALEVRTRGMSLSESEDEARRFLAERFPRADASTLPDHIFEHNIIAATNAHIADAAQDVNAAIFAQAGRRYARLGRMAPFMFGDAPRAQEFEWALRDGQVQLLKRKGAALQDQVMRAKAKEAAYTSAMVENQAAVAQDWGELQALVAGGEDTSRGSVATLRYADERSKALENIATKRDGLVSRVEELDAEAARYDATRTRVVEKLSTEQEQVNAIVDRMTDHETRVTNYLSRAQQNSSNRYLAVAQEEGRAEQLSPGVWKEARNPDYPGSTIYYRLDPATGKVISRRIADDATNFSLAQTVEGAAGHGYGKDLIRAHLSDAGVTDLQTFQGFLDKQVKALEKRPSGFNPILSEAGGGLNRFMGEELRQQQLDAFDRMAEAGQVYLDKEGNPWSREGIIGARKSGEKLRPEYVRALERERLVSRVQSLDASRAAIERGTPEAAVGGKAAAAAKAAFARERAVADRTLNRMRAQMDSAMAAVNKTAAEAKGLVAKAQPAFVKIETAGDLGGLTRLNVPGLEGFAMPSYMADAFHYQLAMHGPDYLTTQWRHFVLGPWKRWATYRNPGFHVRNNFGAWFNGWENGVTHHQYEDAYRILSNKRATSVVEDAVFDKYRLGHVFGESARGKLTYGEIQGHLAAIGVGEANTLSVMGAANNLSMGADMADALSKKSTKLVRATAGKYEKFSRGLGQTVESWHRTAHWLHGMQITNGDTFGARAFSMMLNGDYADLTAAEDHIRDLVPFYKWMRTNVPYQLRMLAENPARLTLVADKLKSYAYDVAGYDRQDSERALPDYMKQDLNLPIPSWVPFVGSKGPDAIKYAMLNLPYSDLYNGLSDYISSALPVGRNILESYGLGEVAFSKTQLTGKMVPLSGAFNLPGIRDVLSAVGMAKKGADGNLYIDDKMNNVLAGVPIYSRFRNFVLSDTDRVEQRLGGLLSFIAGVNISNPSSFTDGELAFYYHEVQPVLDQYRSMGVVFPSAKDFIDAAPPNPFATTDLFAQTTSPLA